MRVTTQLSLAAVLIALGTGAGYWLGHTSSPSTAQPGANPAATADNTGRKVLYWYDPMSPNARFDKPGKSPFMDMDLVPRYADEGDEQNGVRISAAQQQNLGVRTARVTRRTMASHSDAFGTVATDERSVEAIPALASGVVEKLYVNATQQFVKRGEPLALLWYPQWAAAQQEYLAVRRMGDSALTAAARARLQLQFMPESVIRSAERHGKPQTRVTLTAPADGYISKLNIRAGTQVAAAQELFELSSLDPVWIVISYPENQASQITTGSKLEATTQSWPGKVFQGRVEELLPDLDVTTRTLQARVVLDNPQHLLKPGMYLQTRLAQGGPAPSVLAIPQEALIMTGSNNRVLVTKGDGWFTPVTVTAGRSQDGWTEITAGLSEGQNVVTSGQFLIDSEASLRSALPQMSDTTQPAAEKKTAATYSTTGVVNALNSAEGTVTLSHQPVPALKWPAMTMDFTITPALSRNLHPGDQVMFSFSVSEEGAAITTIMPAGQMNHTGHKEQP
ncbi:efflux RND transporter periplasmic adaptor subunit [Shimwellia blattae]|uniref:Putative efflux transporter n=1 Tax=Shimwellia blattae (strain ATCC 29907 / DSM 4481 / JCM 1650 / NBRC 105725 / CDC 9005-74) TaxID=630626 RepID=I2B3R3_SHIBC|nr:efflux RND transporter periplasmic adaptor subunit [Shimwellia blattae]AFJ45167.1 putative efflux transporter [Shimwellia blattae DSM 4481 = NBRC 105725]GAB80715.1 cation efflux system protein CusB [Shimwellia blattae DSM 4481 = NBRC 105725]VDY62650.1 Cation efflux system protein CusB precursor [Shimwellia blattae]VEC19366.1 Cation efflux system protein CusB precursor [Shimwellia blattae]